MILKLHIFHKFLSEHYYNSNSKSNQCYLHLENLH